MGRLINADAIVHYQTYDDEHEDFQEHESTIADFLDSMTDEGCPNPVDAVPVRHGRWTYHIDDLFPAESTKECDQCHEEQPLTCDDNFCPHCGARMDGKDGDNHG
jgi:hypothetical protein